MTRHPGSVGRSYPVTEEQRARYEATMRYELDAMRDDDPLDTAAGKPCWIGAAFLAFALPALLILGVPRMWAWLAEVLA